MKKIKIGILLGVVAGIIDVIPMIMQKLTWDANISAFTMWIVVGFLIATIDLKINSIIKGILTAFFGLIADGNFDWLERACFIDTYSYNDDNPRWIARIFN